MVLFDKNRNMVIKTSILTNIPNVYRKKLRSGGETFVLTLKDDPERKYIMSTDLEMLLEECVKNYGYVVETNLEQATTDLFPYIVIDEVSENIVLCDDGKFRLYGYSDEKPFTLFDGISPSSLSLRLKKGMSLEEAINTPVKEQNKYLLDGKYVKYPEVKRYCQEYGANESTVMQYWSDKGEETPDVRDIVKILLEKKENRIVTYHGKKYPNFSEAISDLEIKESPSTIKNRMEKHGMSFEEVVDADPRMFKGGRIFQYKDKVYYSFKELSEGVNIPEGTLRKRLNNGLSVEEAVEAPRNQIVKNREVITYKGKTYKMWSEFFEENPLFKLARASIQNRRKSGMSIEEALEDYAEKYFVTDHKGNVFRNKKERSSKYGLKPSTVHNRLKMGWSLEKALTTPAK